jgi:nicotinamide riboside transporter PnuC
MLFPFIAYVTDGTKINCFSIKIYTSVFFITIISMIINGIISALFKYRNKYIISTVINIIAVMVFILSPQPYATALLFIFLVIKVLIFTKKQ